MGWTTKIQREEGAIATCIHLSVKLFHSSGKKGDLYHLPHSCFFFSNKSCSQLRELWKMVSYGKWENVLLYLYHPC